MDISRINVCSNNTINADNCSGIDKLFSRLAALSLEIYDQRVTTGAEPTPSQLDEQQLVWKACADYIYRLNRVLLACDTITDIDSVSEQVLKLTEMFQHYTGCSGDCIFDQPTPDVFQTSGAMHFGVDELVETAINGSYAHLLPLQHRSAVIAMTDEEFWGRMERQQDDESGLVSMSDDAVIDSHESLEEYLNGTSNLVNSLRESLTAEFYSEQSSLTARVSRNGIGMSDDVAYFRQLTDPENAPLYGAIETPDDDKRPTVGKQLSQMFDLTLTSGRELLVLSPNSNIPIRMYSAGVFDPTGLNLTDRMIPRAVVNFNDNLTQYNEYRIVSLGAQLTAGTVSTVSAPLSGMLFGAKLGIAPDYFAVTNASQLEVSSTPGASVQQFHLFDGARMLGGYPAQLGYQSTRPTGTSFLPSGKDVTGSSTRYYMGRTTTIPTVVNNLWSSNITIPAGTSTQVLYSFQLPDDDPNYLGRLKFTFWGGNNFVVSNPQAGNLTFNVTLRNYAPWMGQSSFNPSPWNIDLGGESSVTTSQFSLLGGEAVVGGGEMFRSDTTLSTSQQPYWYPRVNSVAIGKASFQLVLVATNTNAAAVTIVPSNGLGLQGYVELMDSENGSSNLDNVVLLVDSYDPAANQNVNIKTVANVEATPSLALARQLDMRNYGPLQDPELFSASRRAFDRLGVAIPGFTYVYPESQSYDLEMSRSDIRAIGMVDFKKVARSVTRFAKKHAKPLMRLGFAAATRDPVMAAGAFGDMIGMRSSFDNPRGHVGMVDECTRIEKSSGRLRSSRPDNQVGTPQNSSNLQDLILEAELGFENQFHCATALNGIGMSDRRAVTSSLIESFLGEEQTDLEDVQPGPDSSGEIDVQIIKFGRAKGTSFVVPDTSIEYLINYAPATYRVDGKSKPIVLAVIASNKPVKVSTLSAKKNVIASRRYVYERRSIGDKVVNCSKLAFSGAGQVRQPSILSDLPTYSYLTVVPLVKERGDNTEERWEPKPDDDGQGRSIGACLHLTLVGLGLHMAVTGDLDESGQLMKVYEVEQKLASLLLSKADFKLAAAGESMSETRTSVQDLTVSAAAYCLSRKRDDVIAIVCNDLVSLLLANSCYEVKPFQTETASVAVRTKPAIQHENPKLREKASELAMLFESVYGVMQAEAEAQDIAVSNLIPAYFSTLSQDKSFPKESLDKARARLSSVEDDMPQVFASIEDYYKAMVPDINNEAYINKLLIAIGSSEGDPDAFEQLASRAAVKIKTGGQAKGPDAKARAKEKAKARKEVVKTQAEQIRETKFGGTVRGSLFKF